ncbi:porin family protein [Nonlabens antarcticus]|uniref:porin family protein n=1 Tax=Nonlabens antarcticus TaxID=392714 RepID=UPI00189114B2|nr:porin family protein [Nonlabens antarcticus]
MKKFLIALCLFYSLLSVAQDRGVTREENAIPEVVDSLYREDQFYLGLSFNLLINEPPKFSQNGFSGGIHLGFIRDMPINKRRNVAIGVGLGFSTNTFNSNLFIGESEDGQSIFKVLDDNEIDFRSNRFNTNLIEVPIQFRWRTSTATATNFWRIYPGMKLGYIFAFKSTFRQNDITLRQTDVPELNKLRYVATLAIGNGSFNAFVHYNLNTLFDNEAVTSSGSKVGLQPIKFGVEFYLF